VKSLPNSLQPGDLVDGKYRVDRVLGRGGMGIVVQATHLTLGTTVAIKVLARAGGESSRRSVAALVREAQVAARLRSEHVARVFDVGTLEDGTPFVVMEHLEGCTLHEAIYGGGPKVTVERAVELLLEACDGVEEAHALGIIHRDLKPSNLFLARRPNGRDVLKVLDFGIAKLLSDAHAPLATVSADGLELTGEVTVGTSLVGTPQYMAPEQFDRVPSISVASDVWSLGVILYELLTGRRPFEGKLVELIWKVTCTTPAAPRELCPEVPEELQAVVLRCLAREAAQRYRSVAELADALRPFARLVVAAPRTSTVPPSYSSVETASIVPAPVKPRKRRALLSALAVAAAALAVAGGAFATQRRLARRPAPTASAAPSAAAAAPKAPAPAAEVILAGSSTVSDLGARWSSALSASRTDLSLRVTPTSTSAGLGALARREVDLAGASRPANDEELALARSEGVELEPHVVARDALAVVVHPDNRVNALSLEQLRGILTGRVTQWSAVGGAKGPIHILARAEDQGSSEIVQSLVLHPGDTIADSAEIVRRSDDTLARVLHDPFAVTVVPFQYVGSAKAVKLRVGSGPALAPSAQTIRSDKYPLIRELFLYTRPDSNAQARAVLAFVERSGRSITAESGFVPPPSRAE
jgi:serine/threonine-protein kinase